MTTGWPPGMLQDDSSELSRWLSNRLDARHIVRKNLAMTHYTPTQVCELADSYKFPGNRTAIVLRELADQVEALTAERDALQADVARLDWLSASAESHGFCHTGFGEYRYYAHQFDGCSSVRETLDKAMMEMK